MSILGRDVYFKYCKWIKSPSKSSWSLIDVLWQRKSQKKKAMKYVKKSVLPRTSSRQNAEESAPD